MGAVGVVIVLTLKLVLLVVVVVVVVILQLILEQQGQRVIQEEMAIQPQEILFTVEVVEGLVLQEMLGILYAMEVMVLVEMVSNIHHYQEHMERYILAQVVVVVLIQMEVQLLQVMVD